MLAEMQLALFFSTLSVAIALCRLRGSQ